VNQSQGQGQSVAAETPSITADFSPLTQIVVVLSHTSHPGNIGAAARAMKTMGLKTLRLVNPDVFPSEIAVARASGATDVLDDAWAVPRGVAILWARCVTHARQARKW
jgi:tRNA/rRNA methyltransferase